jgi:hypothetical protein
MINIINSVTSLKTAPYTPRVSIPEVAEEGREEHVANDKGSLESSGLAILNLVLVLDLSQNS